MELNGCIQLVHILLFCLVCSAHCTHDSHAEQLPMLNNKPKLLLYAFDERIAMCKLHRIQMHTFHAFHIHFYLFPFFTGTLISIVRLR